MAGWQAGWPADKIHVIFKIFKFNIGQIVQQIGEIIVPLMIET